MPKCATSCPHIILAMLLWKKSVRTRWFPNSVFTRSATKPWNALRWTRWLCWPKWRLKKAESRHICVCSLFFLIIKVIFIIESGFFMSLIVEIPLLPLIFLNYVLFGSRGINQLFFLIWICISSILFILFHVEKFPPNFW